jgi:two-component system sensor histidine kinase MtrB
LSAGLLEERMRVVGEDDLALLARSFNQMAANLQRQIVQLEDLSRLQRRFTSDVSHELRTPLTTVRMAADVLFSARDEFDPSMRRAAELLQTEVDRFESLLTDLLEISRYDAGFAVLEAEPADLRELVRQTADFIDPLARRAGCELRVSVPDQPVIAEVDPRRVGRVLRNLLGNAVEHGEGRPVDVVLAVDACAVALTVRDRGVGFKPDEAQIVFNRFWRADPSRARQTGGTGLGLSISLEDARLHGGWLQAWGEPGEGAQFRLTLPLEAGTRLTGSPLPLVPEDAAARTAPVSPVPSTPPAFPSGEEGARGAAPARTTGPATVGPSRSGRPDDDWSGDDIEPSTSDRHDRGPGATSGSGAGPGTTPQAIAAEEIVTGPESGDGVVAGPAAGEEGPSSSAPGGGSAGRGSDDEDITVADADEGATRPGSGDEQERVTEQDRDTDPDTERDRDTEVTTGTGRRRG